jgi:hypothetical protein
MGISAGPNGISDGLVFELDAANFRSYSGSGLTANGLVSGIGGTLVNGVGFGSTSNGFYIFDGSNDYINIPSTSLVYGASPRTMMSWARITSNDGSTHASFAYGNPVSNQAFFIGIYGLNPFCGAWANDLTATNTSININTWFHTACVFDGSIAYLYVSGILTTSASKGWSTTNINRAYLGRQADNLQYWNGHISQVQLYNRVLSASEILQVYNAQRTRFGV